MDFMVWTLKGKHSIKCVYFGKIGTKLRMNQITSIVIHNGIVTQFRFDSLGKHLARTRMNYMPYKKTIHNVRTTCHLQCIKGCNRYNLMALNIVESEMS